MPVTLETMRSSFDEEESEILLSDRDCYAPYNALIIKRMSALGIRFIPHGYNDPFSHKEKVIFDHRRCRIVLFKEGGTTWKVYITVAFYPKFLPSNNTDRPVYRTDGAMSATFESDPAVKYSDFKTLYALSFLWSEGFVVSVLGCNDAHDVNLVRLIRLLGSINESLHLQIFCPEHMKKELLYQARSSVEILNPFQIGSSYYDFMSREAVSDPVDGPLFSNAMCEDPERLTYFMRQIRPVITDWEIFFAFETDEYFYKSFE